MYVLVPTDAKGAITPAAHRQRLWIVAGPPPKTHITVDLHLHHQPRRRLGLLLHFAVIEHDPKKGSQEVERQKEKKRERISFPSTT